MKEIDWSKAPEGATHWTPESDVVCPFLREDNGVWFWWSDSSWVPFYGTSWNSQLLGIVKRPSLSPWNGTGLPPVGTVCIVKPHNTQWGFSSVAGHERTVLAYHGEFVWLGQGNMALETTRIDKVDFLPLRTPEQIAAEEREKAVEHMVKCIAENTTGVGMSDAMICAKALYDAGYRRQEPSE